MIEFVSDLWQVGVFSGYSGFLHIGVEETIGKGKDTVCFQTFCPANSNKYVIDQELQYTDDVLRSIFIAYVYA
jgi:hypothetical protein